MLRVVRSLQSLRQGLPKAYLFLSRANSNTILYRESVEILNDLGFPYLKQYISNKQAIARCAGEGTTVFDQGIKDSIKEFDSLFSEVTYG
jgi:chromosome partitioning protein